ncbi:unnamed protein product [Timema podura]|uniref:Piezo THU9 and anchor domain-containing protein n=1 Tax=Timema podura TaxID=61482 RepID=A0ABN7P171_TIMPD|nr:unnamed protein product [Timema podura]
MRLPPQIWYMFKCMYFLLSAYQIRCGYPTRIIGNVFCKKYNITNFVLLIGKKVWASDPPYKLYCTTLSPNIPRVNPSLHDTCPKVLPNNLT